MQTINPENFADDQFPKHLRSLIPTALRTAYSAANHLAESDPILQVESAKDNKGRLISWAADLAFVRLIKTGQLPFDYSWKSFSSPTGRFLELRLSHSIATISQISDPKRQPRSVRFRDNRKLNNQTIFDFGEEHTEQAVAGLPHFLITHGHKELNFSHLAVPHPENNVDYSWRSQNLMSLPHAVPTTGPDEEDTDTDFEELNLIKEEIEKWRKDNDD